MTESSTTVVASMPGPGAAKELAQAIRSVAQRAQTEEDLRVGVEHALASTLQVLGLTVIPEYEKTLFTGSADAVYGHVVIEYKRPGRMREKGYPAKLAEQIGRYMTDHARHVGGQAKQIEALEKMIGVGLDGQNIMYLRYSASGRQRESPLPSLPGTQLSFIALEEHRGGIQTMGPVPVGRESIELLLLYLRSLSRKPLTPESLAADFGPEGQIAPRLVSVLYSALQDHRTHSRVATFFSEWDRIFGIVYGEELGQAEKDASELASLYQVERSAELKALFFAVHTYYALLMKLLAVELASLQGGALVGSFVANLQAIPEEQMHRALIDLENGGTFGLLGINNFLEGDFFGWYLDTWSENLADGVRTLAVTLASFEPATTTLEPEYTRDLLKKLYQYLVPRKLRHDLGEYYTPDWLAERLLNQVGYKGNPSQRILDPGCGSGTFLILALRRMRQFAADHLIAPSDILDAALRNVIGFDLNPLSVIAARTNYLLALGDLLRYRRGAVDLPVYLCDSILTPSARGDIFGKSYRLNTVVGSFEIPDETVAAGEMGRLSALLEACVRQDYAPEEFLARAQRDLSVRGPMTKTVLEALYRRLLALEQEGRNGIWARLLKNAFAPVLVARCDFVVGNPPWVNWESLSADYRDATRQLWVDYGLFSLRGFAARLGGGKKDLAMLFTYAAVDHYLKPGGKLGFVITQTVFKTKGGGDGFRRFQLGESDVYLRVLHVDDLSRIQPFEGATNRTSVMICQRGQKTRYPVVHTLWKKGAGSARVDIDKPLAEVLNETTRSQLWSQPVSIAEPTSPWMTAHKAAIKALRKVIGQAAYKAWEGANTGGANGVYWLEILSVRPDGLLVVRNLPEMGRKRVDDVTEAIESNLVFPLLRGQDVSQWKATPSLHILIAQDPDSREGYDETRMKVNYLRTFSYLARFRPLLEERPLYLKFFSDKGAAFYSMYNVGPYTFAPYKVVWREQADTLTVAVVDSSDRQTVVPDHKLMLVPFDKKQEAHFVCAALASTIAQLVVKSYVVEVSTSTHVLDYIAIPKFEAGNSLHNRMADLSKRAHKLAVTEDRQSLAAVEEEVDVAAAELWGISEVELKEIRRSLVELG